MRTEQLRSLWQLAFGDSEEFIHLFFDTAYAPERCQTITIDDQVAAALYWFDTECGGQKFAYIYAVATHPDFRNRGLCRELMERTHALLAEQGYDGALLMPAEAGLRQMYGKMGYRDCCNISAFSCAAGEEIPVRRISKEEYARLRRAFLPLGSVIQEGANLDYLETFARFYAGDHFLLVAAPWKGKLNGIELLGNKAAAPGILRALGFAEGMFRTPGEDIPFAMFRPLKEHAAPPKYFGLAFD